MITLEFHEICPLSGEAISWKGNLENIVDEMLEEYQHRTECTEMIVEQRKKSVMILDDPRQKAEKLRSIMIHSTKWIGATYTYAWQVSE